MTTIHTIATFFHSAQNKTLRRPGWLRNILLACSLLLIICCTDDSQAYTLGNTVMITNIATPIKNAIAATNQGDTDAFIRQFTDDAELTDWGRHFAGRSGILRWNKTDNIGVNASMEVISAKEVTRDGLKGQAVTVNVKSHNFTGTGLIQFYLQNDHIYRVFIEP